LLFSADEVFYAPALPLEEVFDPTGAGDTFAGGLMGYLSIQEELSFESMKKAVIVGSALASFCVEKFGTQRLEELTKNELDDRIKTFYSLSQFELV
jgi:sugar/nucleoside kinase (ribokinase family)